jgi:polysaccharide export outer membrane protein
MARPLLLAALLVVTATAIVFAQTSVSNGLQPGDVIKLSIWRELEMSGEFLVHEDGTAVLPRLGPVVVVGKEPEALKRELIEEYSKTLRNPSIEIILLRRVTITGEVRSPGLYPVNPTMSLTDALALAGGASPTADREKVVLIRGDERTTFNVEEALSIQDLSLRSGDQLYVPQRSWFSRNWPLAASLLGTALTLTTFILTRL